MANHDLFELQVGRLISHHLLSYLFLVANLSLVNVKIAFDWMRFGNVHLGVLLYDASGS